MIEKLYLHSLKNGEYVQFITDGLGIVNGLATVAAAVTAPKAALTTKLAELNAIFVTDQASALTDDLADLDRQRDSLLSGLKMLCKAFTYHTDPSYKEAGDTLSRSIEIYGDVNNQSYNAQSASISSLVNDWTTKSELLAASALVHADDFIAPLGTTNASFTVLYNQRITEMSTTINADSLKEKRSQTNAAWKTLVEKLNANIVLNDAAGAWGQAQDRLNTLIGSYKELLASRAGRAAASNGGDQTTPPPPGGGLANGGGGSATP